MPKKTKTRGSVVGSKKFNADQWLKNHLGNLVDKFAGEYILVVNGRIYRGASPSQLREKARAENPHAEILGLRVPSPQDFTCALTCALNVR